VVVSAEFSEGIYDDRPMFMAEDGRLKTYEDLLAEMRALAHDLRAASDTGLLVQQDLAHGLATILTHATRLLDAAEIVTVDLPNA